MNDALAISSNLKARNHSCSRATPKPRAQNRVDMTNETQQALAQLNQEVMACTQCSRLIAHCQKIGQVKRRAYLDWEYWAKPVPGFGDINAKVLILGLAPGAHGSNRTGRPFTGDGSGNFLYRVLHRAGLASQPTATHKEDGLTLRNAYLTAVVRRAPPQNKPTPEEIRNCSHFLDREIDALKEVRVIVALGKIG